MSNKQEILQTIKEALGEELKWILYQQFDFIDGVDTETGITDNVISFNLVKNQELHIDLAQKQFTIITFKFDYYRDPCPGYEVDSEEDVTEKCLKLIGDLADIMEVFSEPTRVS